MQIHIQNIVDNPFLDCFSVRDVTQGESGQAHFLEMEPEGRELPPYACEQVMPGSDLAVISATTLINKTLPRLLELGRAATAIVLGPSTPMNRVLLDHGADILAGVRVMDTDALVSSVMQGVKKFAKLAGLEPITSCSQA